MESNFVDYVKIYCESGKGGDGSVHWRREKYIPRGGPDGGDGGRGGHIIVRGNAQHWTLLDLKYRKFIKAGNGEAGRGAKCHGKDGEDVILEVPVGTVLKNDVTGEIIGEITQDKQEILVLAGGRGGKGNWFFRSPTRQTPDFAQPGEPAQTLELVLELKVLADVGLVGFPNTGKSTLLATLTAAKPEIADYPFTTLVPNLGIVAYRDYHSFVMADLPGLIEGASEGRGLGIRFLRHIERNAVLLFLIPVTTASIKKDFKILLNELSAYEPALLEKPRLLAISQCDLVPPNELVNIRKKLPTNIDTVFISSVTGLGLEILKDKLWQLLANSDDERQGVVFAKANTDPIK